MSQLQSRRGTIYHVPQSEAAAAVYVETRGFDDTSVGEYLALQRQRRLAKAINSHPDDCEGCEGCDLCGGKS